MKKTFAAKGYPTIRRISHRVYTHAVIVENEQVGSLGFCGSLKLAQKLHAQAIASNPTRAHEIKVVETEIVNPH